MRVSKMNENFIRSIQAIISAYPEINPKQKNAILAACGEQSVRQELINRKAVREILGISDPTIRQWIARGLIKPVVFSKRKIRFVKNDILALAHYGVPSENRGVTL